MLDNLSSGYNHKEKITALEQLNAFTWHYDQKAETLTAQLDNHQAKHNILNAMHALFPDEIARKKETIHIFPEISKHSYRIDFPDNTGRFAILYSQKDGLEPTDYEVTFSNNAIIAMMAKFGLEFGGSEALKDFVTTPQKNNSSPSR